MIALTRHPTPALAVECELTFVERRPISFERVVAEHEAYRAALEAEGCEVVVLPALPSLPDSVFVEDVAVVLPEVAVLCRSGATSRRPEVDAMAPTLEAHRPTERIRAPACLEGGDVLRMGRRLFVGLSTRTNREGVERLKEIVAPLGYEVVPVTVLGALHLKSGCAALDDGTVLLNPEWIQAETFEGMRLVEVDPGEPFGAGAVRVGKGLIMGEEYPRTRRRVEEAGFRVRAVPLAEFGKAEAGPTCLSLLLG